MTETERMGGARSQVFWFMECARCGDECWDDDGRPVFDSEAKAWESVDIEDPEDGWSRRADGRVLCRRCGKREDCKENGHRMGEWHPSPLSMKRDSDEEFTIENRWCEHCLSTYEERLTGPAGVVLAPIREGDEG